MITIEMDNGSTIDIELDYQAAPLTANNFAALVRRGFYDGLIFHRVIPGFVIQGGDPEGTGMGGSTPVKGEFRSNGVDNPLLHKRGTLSLARTNNPNSGSCQFFICHADCPNLDGNYAAFGRVVRGIEVVDQIASLPTGERDRPLRAPVMRKVTCTDPEPAAR